MERLNNHKKREGFFKNISPLIAHQLTKALQKLSGEKIKVESKALQTFEQSKVVVDIGEKCFGSYVNFVSPKDNLEGIVIAIFPLSSVKILTELLLKRYLSKLGKEKIDPKMKLDAFKEALSILLSTYTAEIANTLKIKLKANIPKFVCLHSLELMKSTLLRKYSNVDNLVSVEQFDIVREDVKAPPIKGRFIVTF